MKRKGITFWEQNIERIVLGVAALFCVGFSLWQIALREPNRVDGARPGEIDQQLREAATALDSRINSSAPSPVTMEDYDPVVDEFQDLLASGVAPAPTMLASHPRPTVTTTTGIIADARYVEPEIAAPHSIRVEQFFDAIQPEVVSQFPELTERFAESPHDVTWMTAAALFDLKSIRQAYAAGRDGVEPIPTEWYGGHIDVLDVRVEREELVAGEWTNHTLLPPLTGQFSFRPILSGAADQSAKSTIMQQLATENAQQLVLQPPFYPLVNSSWAAPDPHQRQEEITGGMSEEELARLRKRRQLTRLMSQRQSATDTLLAEGGQLTEPDPPQGAGDPPSRPGGGGPGGAAPPGAGSGPGLGGAGGGRRQSGAAEKAKQERHKRLRATIARLTAQIDRLADDLGEQERIAAMQEQAIVPMMDRDEIVVWAHDMNLEPGKTYRYRFAVDVYNPFFARKLDLIEEQHALADGLTIRSLESDWSAPARVIPPLRVFVTKALGPARNGGNLGLGQATARVFRFEHGRWWEESFSVEPGDQVGGVKPTQPMRVADPSDPTAEPRLVYPGPKEIDYGTEWIVLDVMDRMDVSPEDADRGLGAMVLLQSTDDPARRVALDPNEIDRDSEYEFLRAAVEQAEAQAELGG